MPNQLLGLLPLDDQNKVISECETLVLDQRQILIDVDEPIRHAYFPLSGIVSQVTVLSDGNAIEVTTVGNDGYVGLSAYLGEVISPSRFIVQLPGEGLRLPASRLRELSTEMPRLGLLLARYNDFLMAVAAQTSACNRLHRVEQRCARWLLRVRDRMESADMPLTQDFLSQMLGVRRASVSIAAGLLQEAGYIRYNYGRVTIVDQPGLEQVACECVATIRRRYQASFAPLIG